MSMHNKKICPYCMEKLTNDSEYYMVGLETPYMNLFFHLEHYLLIKDNLFQFLTENTNNWYNTRDKIKKGR